MPHLPKRPLNKTIIDQWPEIFADVDLTAIPVPYLHSVMITFKDGRQWSVVLKPEDRDSVDGEIPKSLTELFENYQDHIQHVDFRLDVDKIKHDITQSTRRFLKRKRK